jgi:hypothetical protein
LSHTKVHTDLVFFSASTFNRKRNSLEQAEAFMNGRAIIYGKCKLSHELHKKLFIQKKKKKNPNDGD